MTEKMWQGTRLLMGLRDSKHKPAITAAMLLAEFLNENGLHAGECLLLDVLLPDSLGSAAVVTMVVHTDKEIPPEVYRKFI